MNRGRHHGRPCWELQTVRIKRRSVQSASHWFPLLVIFLRQNILIFPRLLLVAGPYDTVRRVQRARPLVHIVLGELLIAVVAGRNGATRVGLNTGVVILRLKALTSQNRKVGAWVVIHLMRIEYLF